MNGGDASEAKGVEGLSSHHVRCVYPGVGIRNRVRTRLGRASVAAEWVARFLSALSNRLVPQGRIG